MSFNMDDYVDVAERIAMFTRKHPEGSLRPYDPAEPVKIMMLGDRTFLLYVACAYRSPDDQAPGIGVAWEAFPGRTPYTRDSEVMNCETSAWGRAIVATLAADTKKVASANEVRRNQDQQPPDRGQVLGRLHKIIQKIEPELQDDDRHIWLRGEMQARGLDGSKTEDLIKLADQFEQEASQ